eukprot:comp17661_c0_seq1/m.17454 comp17661_c0_seq1/g.17454  ORF comp17661_c0_seq1/g.17454 comp17661_c0_seq1/m.17454 type:complete len:779 (-) comp17661_c0_seq1:302-2638(-)
MGDSSLVVRFPRNHIKCILVKWLVKEGDELYVGQPIARYDYELAGVYVEVKEGEARPKHRVDLKCERPHMRVAQLLVKEGVELENGVGVVRLETGCAHEVVVSGVCAECGTDVTIGHYGAEGQAEAKVAVVHGIPDLHISQTAAQQLGLQDEQQLTASQRLALVVDLDQTLLHATTAPFVDDWLTVKDSKSLEDIHSFYIPGSPIKYFVKLRPYARQLLTELAPYFEMHIYTMGTRAYAQIIADILDPGQKNGLFQNRILSRDDGFDPNFKAPALKAIFPSGDRMVAILDDREDVWMGVPNLMRVRPYYFFPGVQEINLTPLDMLRHASPSSDGAAKPDGAKAPTGGGTGEGDGEGGGKGVDKAPEEGVDEEGGGLTHKKRRHSTCQEPPEGMRQISAREVNILKPHIETAVKACSVQGASVPDTDLMDWWRLGCDQALANIVKSLQYHDFNTAVAKLRACREAFVVRRDVAAKGGAKRQKTEGIEGSDTQAEEKEQPQTYTGPESELFGPDSSHDLAVLVSIFSKTQVPAGALPPPIPNDKDDVLKYLLPALAQIHERFFTGTAKQIATHSVAHCLGEVRWEVLQGCRIVFSGIIPTDTKSKDTHDLWLMAMNYGAECQEDVTEGVTHVVARRPGTAKVSQAQTTAGCCVVHVDWLRDSIAKWARMTEENYPLEGVPVFNGLPVPSGSLFGSIDFDALDEEVDSGSDDSDDSKVSTTSRTSKKDASSSSSSNSSSNSSSSDSSSEGEGEGEGEVVVDASEMDAELRKMLEDSSDDEE